MKLRSATGEPRRLIILLKQLCGYVGAAVIPWLSITISLQSRVLQTTPVALSLAAVAAVTIFAGLGPGVFSAIATSLIFNNAVLAPPRFFAWTGPDLLHTVIILVIALLIVTICQRQRLIGFRLQAAMASLEARTDSLIQAQQGSNSAAWMYNAESRHLHWAEGGSEVFGRPFSGFESADGFVRRILQEDRARVLNTVETATAVGQKFQVEFRVRWPNGELHWLESRGTPAPDNPRIWHGVTIDITDRKNAESALVRSEKLAAIGRLSATVAHEINNPLEAVTNLLFLARTDPQLAEETREYLERADQELARLGSIARRTLTFVRPKTSKGPSDVHDVVESVVAMFQPRCSARGAEIRVVQNGRLTLPVPADDLRQILTNIVSNACDALPHSGGVIEVEVAREANVAAISIRDNGSGISPENAVRVFDPFFTTKEDTGTGIGLWVTRDLVDKNGGRILLETDHLPAGFRTQFRMEFAI